MQRTVFKSRLERLTVIAAHLENEESITIDRDLLRKADIWPFERVEISNHDNGARFTTYVIEGESGSGMVAVNGPAAHLVRVGHKLTITAFLTMTESDIPQYRHRIVTVDEKNRPGTGR